VSIIGLISDVNLQAFEDDVCNAITPVVFLIGAIDRVANDVWIKKQLFKGKVRAISTNHECGYCLFLKEERMIDRLNAEVEFIGNLDLEINLTSPFRHLVFWNVGHTLSMPNIYSFPKQNPVIKRLVGEEGDMRARLDIAIIPFIHSWGQGMPKYPEPVQGHGVRLFWRYPDEGIQRAKDRTLNLLRRALSQNPHIIIFPEYCIGPAQLCEIRKYLAEHSEDAPNLLFLVAGSTWITEPDTSGGMDQHNNVSLVLDSKGDIIGSYYKNLYSTHYHRLIRVCRCEMRTIVSAETVEIS